MGRKNELKSLPSLVELPDGEELPFDGWPLSEKEKYQKRMMEELETRFKYYDKQSLKKYG